MSAHVPVMLDDVMAILAPRDDAIYVDATFGGGGYTAALLSRARCTVYAIDRDEDAIARGRVLAESLRRTAYADAWPLLRDGGAARRSRRQQGRWRRLRYRRVLVPIRRRRTRLLLQP